MKAYDAVVIGAGHNGLIAAAYLAKAGRRIVVVERRNVVGGLLADHEVAPGAKGPMRRPRSLPIPPLAMRSICLRAR